MKKWKRILSAVLVCAMVLPLATTYVNADANDSNSTENVVWFTEDFKGTTDDIGVNGTGWNNLGSFTLDTTNEVLKSKTSGQYTFLNQQQAMSWSNYTVEADVVVTDEVIGSYTATGRWGGIVAAVSDCSRTGSNKGSGYEFMICYNKDGSTYCALKDRNGTSSGSANVDYAFNLNTSYNLKMELNGNKITCYINDQPVISNHQINITGDLTGSVGFHSAGQYCTFDNLKVYTHGLIFNEEFVGTTDDIGVNGTGWNNLGNFTLDTTAAKLKSKTSGQYSFLNRQEALSWTDYTVEADVVVTDEVIGSYTATGRWGGIVAAVTDCSRYGSNKGSGYEFMICYNKDGSTYCALKDRSGTSSGSANVDYAFNLNTSYNLKMELKGNKITCYINDQPVITNHQINITGDLTGSIGVHSAGQYCTFDNIRVWENQPESVVGDKTILIAGSDFQNKQGNDEGKQAVQELLSSLAKDGITTADGFFSCGDYDVEYSETEQGVNALKEAVSNVVTENMVFVQGNHDNAIQTGVISPSGDNDPVSGDYGVFVINEDDYMWHSNKNKHNRETIKRTAQNLSDYLNQKLSDEYDKPIFVLSHLPLNYSMRTKNNGDGMYAKYIFDVLNEAGQKGLNIIFLFGHNHSKGWDDYLGGGSVYLKKGDDILIAQNSQTEFKKESLQFTYMNAGYIGYYDNENDGADAALTMTVFKISDNEVEIVRYDKNGVHNLKSAGVTNTAQGESGYEPNTTIYASPQKVTLTAVTDSTPLGDLIHDANTTENVVWFTEDFKGTTDNVGNSGTGWNNLGNFTLDTTDEVLKTKTSGQYIFYSKLQAMSWSNYTVEADVVVTDEVIDSYTATGRWGGIVAAVTDCSRTAGSKGSGYEFMICYNKDGSTYCALKDRSGTSSGSSNVAYAFDLNTSYNLKMELKGNTITCYINDQVVISNHPINITGDLTGSIGLHSAGQYCTFDNIQVYSNGLLFNEEFVGTTDDIGVNGTGWNNLGNFTLDTEEARLQSKISGQYSFLNRQDALSWSNYTVEANVVVTDEVIDSYTANGRWAGIVAAVTDCSRTGANAGSGYEFMICYNKDGSTYCALKDRSGTSSGSSNIPYEFELNKTYTLKMELDGNKINCYINNELVIEEHAITIQGDLTGTIGLHSAGQYCTFDNINVWENTNLNDDEDNKDEDNKEDLEDGIWFKETFGGTNQDLASKGWDQGKTAILTADKQLELSAKVNSSMYLTGHDGASEWTNYTAEVDVIITDTEIAGNTAKNRVAGLIVAANSKKAGYEFMIGYTPSTDNYFYQVKDRITGTNLTKEIAYPFELNEVVNLKMVLVGNTIECYIDGELETTCEVEGVKNLKGTIGVHGVGNVTKFDNILVYESKPSYKLPPLTDVTGSDVWFEDDFSSTDSLMTERGWSKEYQIHDGRVYMPNNNEATAYITGIEKANLWKDYTAETEVYIADDPTVIPTILNPSAFLCVRSTSEKSGYDFGVIWNNGEDIGWVRLRDRTTSTTLAENKNIKIEKDKTYQLKMTVKGNQIDCYLDGELVMSATDTKNSNPTGTVGIRKNGYLTYFDNVVVYKTNRYQSPQTGDMNYVYLYVLVLCTSATLYATIVYRRKNKQNV